MAALQVAGVVAVERLERGEGVAVQVLQTNSPSRNVATMAPLRCRRVPVELDVVDKSGRMSTAMQRGERGAAAGPRPGPTHGV
jgi:hypothetical protein